FCERREHRERPVRAQWRGRCHSRRQEGDRPPARCRRACRDRAPAELPTDHAALHAGARAGRAAERPHGKPRLGALTGDGGARRRRDHRRRSLLLGHDRIPLFLILKPVTPRAYLQSFLAFALFGLALIALVGLAVDGFGVFGTRLIGASRFPPNLRLSISGDRVTKAIEIAERDGDRVLFVGDSRTQHGLDPDAPALSGVKAYNAALAGASLREQIVALDYALAHEPGIRHVVWGLSLEEFPFGIATSGDYADSAFARRSLTSGLLRHLFAFDWVAASFKALVEAPRHVRASMKRNGVAAFDGDPIERHAVAARFEAELAGTERELRGSFPQAALDEAQS